MQTSQNEKAFHDRQKILKKYLSETKSKKQKQYSSSNFFIQDQDDKQESSISVEQSSEEEQHQKKRVRIQSQQDQNNEQDQRQKLRQQVKSVRRKQQNETGDVMKSRKLKKKLKKALGVQNDEQIDEFMKQIKIQGMELSDLKKMLKNNDIQLNFQSQHRQKKQKKKKDKKNKKEKKDKKIKKQEKQVKRQQKFKFQAYHKSSSSDIQIPVQARTIYRNKDGTIKINTDNDLKKKKQEETMNRLAQWEKGMKKQDSDQGDHEDIQFAKIDIWDDPLKVWNNQNLVKPLTCKYMGSSNRFNIKPGCRWDGVIRGNGFQTKYIQEQSLKKARSAKQHKEYLKNL